MTVWKKLQHLRSFITTLRTSPKTQDGPSVGPGVQTAARQWLEHFKQAPFNQSVMDPLKEVSAHQPLYLKPWEKQATVSKVQILSRAPSLKETRTAANWPVSMQYCS